VITGAKRETRDGTTETTDRCWLLKPGGPERRVEIAPFKVVGRFTERERKNGKAASGAWARDRWHRVEGSRHGPRSNSCSAVAVRTEPSVMPRTKPAANVTTTRNGRA